MALDAAFRSEADLRAGLTENLSQARTESDKVDERVRRAFRNFDAAGPTNGERPARANHVDPDVAAFEATSRVMRERLDALDAAPPGKGMAVRVDNSLIEWEGRDHAPGRTRRGSIDLGKLLDALAEGDVSTLSVPAAVTACEAERRAKALVAEIDNAATRGDDESDGETTGTDDVGGDGDGDGDGGGDVTVGGSETVGEFVERSVTDQMGTATSPEARLEYGLIPNSADSNEAQAHLLTTFQLRPGPTDVISYHDFNTLQIAFEDVWTRIFDGELEALGRQVYREYVGLLDFLGYDPDTADPPISSLDDLAWLIGEIRALSRITETSLPGRDGGGVGTSHGGPKDAKNLGEEAGDWLDKNLPGGRAVLAGGTLGISELVLWIMREAASLGRKDPLIWDDLLHDRVLPRRDRIEGSVEPAAVAPGNIDLVLWTDISHKKEIAFQVWDEASQKPRNEVRVANWAGETVNHSITGVPTWYKDHKLVPTRLLTSRSVLEFASEETPTVNLGRYVLGDLDKIVADGGRLVFYWKDS